MKTTPALYAALLGSLLMSSCQSDEATPKPDGLVGRWSLSQLECYCPSNTPTPNEAVEFDAAGHVTEYANGQVVRGGTYQLSTGSTSCATNANLLIINWPADNHVSTYTFSLAGEALVIDQGLCFDAPRKTYTYAGGTTSR